MNAEQRRPPPVRHDGGYLNLLDIPQLSQSAEREYSRKLEAAKAEAKPECERAKREYIGEAVAQLVQATQVSLSGRQIVESRMGGTLVGSDILIFDEYGEVPVAEVLGDPKRYDEATLADPINGDVRGKAIFYANVETRKPLIYSHAHGGGLFFLKHDLFSLTSRLAAISKDEALDEWSTDLPSASLRPDELQRYLNAAQKARLPEHWRSPQRRQGWEPPRPFRWRTHL